MSEEVLNNLVTIAKEFVKFVTRFSYAYKNKEANINKVNPKAITAIGMNTAYHKFLTVYTDKGSMEKFFIGKISPFT